MREDEFFGFMAAVAFLLFLLPSAFQMRPKTAILFRRIASVVFGIAMGFAIWRYAVYLLS